LGKNGIPIIYYIGLPKNPNNEAFTLK
jgi:hypothetical protein